MLSAGKWGLLKWQKVADRIGDNEGIFIVWKIGNLGVIWRGWEGFFLRNRKQILMICTVGFWLSRGERMGLSQKARNMQKFKLRIGAVVSRGGAGARRRQRDFTEYRKDGEV